MQSFSTQSITQLRNVLLRCREFENINSLRSVFITSELLPFRAGLRMADNSAELVNLFLEYIILQKRSGGMPVLPIFINALKERYEIGDSIRDELDQLEIEYEELKTTDTVSIIDKQRVFDLLMRLDFRSQINMVRMIIEKGVASAFLVHGPSECGQRMLVHRLSHLVNKWESGQRIIIDAGSVGVGKSSYSLWREVARRVGLPPHTPKKDLIEKIQLWLLTQDVIIIVHTVDYLPKQVLAEWINEFWIPVARMIQMNDETKSCNNQLVLFLVDYQGKFTDSAIELFQSSESETNDFMPIYLPPTGPFPMDELNAWLEMAFDIIPPTISVENLLDQSNSGIPELVYNKICEELGISWEGELTP